MGEPRALFRRGGADHAQLVGGSRAGGGRRKSARGAAVQVQLDAGCEFSAGDAEELLALDAALRRLAEIDPRASRIVELRYFVGLTNEEIAEVLETSEKTVRRDWIGAKSWLRAELRGRRAE